MIQITKVPYQFLQRSLPEMSCFLPQLPARWICWAIVFVKLAASNCAGSDPPLASGQGKGSSHHSSKHDVSCLVKQIGSHPSHHLPRASSSLLK